MIWRWGEWIVGRELPDWLSDSFAIFDWFSIIIAHNCVLSRLGRLIRGFPLWTERVSGSLLWVLSLVEARSAELLH